MTSSLQLRSIHLSVSDLSRSVDFYARQLGFVVLRETGNRVELSTSRASVPEPLLVLSEKRSAFPAVPESAGLFHAALLFPSRAALAGWLRHAIHAQVAFDGFCDHGVSEAIYLSDPDGNGLEFYVDRPKEAWPREDGQLAMGTRPLDVPALLATEAPGSNRDVALLAGAHWGHFHLRVTNLDTSEKFYSNALGVTLTQRYGTSARFLAADDYHHHLGLNVWGRPKLPYSPAQLGVVEMVFARSVRSDVERLHDPDGIPLRIIG